MWQRLSLTRIGPGGKIDVTFFGFRVRSGDCSADPSPVLLCVVLCLLLQGKRSAPPLTPQPQQQAAKKQKGSEGRPVSASAPAKGPVAKTAAAGGGCVQLIGVPLSVLRSGWRGSVVGRNQLCVLPSVFL